MPKAVKSAKKQGKVLVHAPLLRDLQPPKTYKVKKKGGVSPSVHGIERPHKETNEEIFSDKSTILQDGMLRRFDDNPYNQHNLEHEDEEYLSDEEYGGFDDEDEVDDEDVGGTGDLIEVQGEYVAGGSGLTDAEEAIVSQFLKTDGTQMKSLADIIIEKIREKGATSSSSTTIKSAADEVSIPAKVVEVFSAVGKMLQHYRSGKLPKALKMLPHLKHWEEILWLTRPDEWSPGATYACTRIFASNLNEKLAQRFFNMVLLEKCRDDIKRERKLNYHLYMALKKSLYKPGAFYKGILLPLAQSQTCTLREATIFGSVIAKVSIPADHSAVALLKLIQLPYSGSTSLFIRVLLNKKYALPQRVIDNLVDHFCSAENDSRQRPVAWHQSLLVFVQRYKNGLDENIRKRIKDLMKSHGHPIISLEVKKELASCEDDDIRM